MRSMPWWRNTSSQIQKCHWRKQTGTPSLTTALISRKLRLMGANFPCFRADSSMISTRFLNFPKESCASLSNSPLRNPLPWLRLSWAISASSVSSSCLPKTWKMWLPSSSPTGTTWMEEICSEGKRMGSPWTFYRNYVMSRARTMLSLSSISSFPRISRWADEDEIGILPRQSRTLCLPNTN